MIAQAAKLPISQHTNYYQQTHFMARNCIHKHVFTVVPFAPSLLTSQGSGARSLFMHISVLQQRHSHHAHQTYRIKANSNAKSAHT